MTDDDTLDTLVTRGLGDTGDGIRTADDLLSWAWTFMCNAERCLHGTTVHDPEYQEWIDGFDKFRDAFHEYLSKEPAEPPTDADEPLAAKADAYATLGDPLDERSGISTSSLEITPLSDEERLITSARVAAAQTGQRTTITKSKLGYHFSVTIGPEEPA